MFSAVIGAHHAPLYDREQSMTVHVERPSLAVEVDPAEVGLDAERLRRLDRYHLRQVEQGLIPGFLVLVTRRGRIAHLGMGGLRDREAGLPVEPDTIWRIYSMTKPVASVAAMMLVEEGALRLADPVSRYIPEFADARVLVGGEGEETQTEPAKEPVRVWHLMTHTAGLSYPFDPSHPVDAGYIAAMRELIAAPREEADLAAWCRRWAQIPLCFEPGTRFRYSHATDVLGRVVEVASGASFDEFLQQRILGPLGMVDTAFAVPAEDVPRTAALYRRPPEGGIERADQEGERFLKPPRYFSGGGGLVSTATDYHRFTQMLLRGGELEGVRLLGDRTVRFMTENHLPEGAGMDPIGPRSAFSGVGFGLGFSVVLSPGAAHQFNSPGTYAWGGAASTTFFVDPREEITYIFMTQVLQSALEPGPPVLQALVGP